MGYISDASAALLRGSSGGLRLGVFWRLGTAPPINLAWGFSNDIPIEIPNVDVAGTVYIGAGKLLQIPDLEMLINGVADRVEFGLSGVTPQLIADLDASAPSIVNASVIMGVAPLDERFQPLTSIIPLWCGSADYWTQALEPGSKPTDPPQCSISLSTRAGDTTRARPRYLTFTDRDQRVISSDDSFFSQISRYAPGYLVSWPRF